MIMAQIITLTDRKTGEAVYPVTSTKTVFDEKGVDLDTLLAAQKQETEAALKDYAKKTDLSKKQDALTDSLDVKVSETALTVTERAKRAVFIDQWNTACGIWGRYNEETGYFELNGLTDITYEQALSIMAAGPLIDSLSPFAGGLFSKIRTNLPSVRASGFGYVHRLITLYTYIFSANFEVVNLNPATQEEDLCVSNDHSITDYTFVSRKYIGALNLKLYNKSLNLTTQCGKYNKAFDGLVIKELHTDAKIRASWASVTREYDAEFLTKMVGYATNTTPITIQVEQWAYDRLTDPDNAEWNSILTAAAEKNITFVA